MIHYPKKKDYSLPEILLLEFVYKWLSNFVLFLPSQPPHPSDRACMTCIRPKRKMCQFCYYDPNLLLWSKYTKHSIRISCFVYIVYHVLLEWFIHRFYPQNGIRLQKFHFWPKNDGEKWSRKIFLKFLHAEAIFF